MCLCSYSGSDLAAILGEKDSATAPEGTSQPPPAIALSWLVTDPAEGAPSLQGRSLHAAAVCVALCSIELQQHAKRRLDKPGVAESRLSACIGAQQDQPDDEAKWWFRTFARSGRLGSSAPRPSLPPSTKAKVTEAELPFAPLTSTLDVMEECLSGDITCLCCPMARASVCDDQLLSTPATHQMDCAGQDHWIL